MPHTRPNGDADLSGSEPQEMLDGSVSLGPGDKVGAATETVKTR